MGVFEITRRKNRQFQFNLKADNGEIILTSGGYTAKHNCIKAIEAVRKNCGNDAKYDRRKAKNKQFYFTLKAANGQIIATSEMYTTITARDNGIDAIKKNAPDAEILDLTK